MNALLTNVNNAVLVYDFVNAGRVKSPLDESARLGWTPIDESAALSVVEWFTLTVDGEERLFCACADGWVNMMEEAENGDQVEAGGEEQGVGWVEIETLKRSRAYFNALDGFLKPMAGSVVLQTQRPKYSVSLVFNSVGKLTTLATEVERDRTRYTKPWNALPYNVTNPNDNHAAPYREDYTVTLPVNLGSGVDLGLYQEAVQNFRIEGRSGRWFQVEVSNMQGRCRLAGISLTVVPAPGGQRKGKHV